jgi:molybdopterin-guanine dinucleotide biosynthesis protein A
MTDSRKHPICFFATAAMYNQIQRIAKTREVSLSHLLRELIREFLKLQDCQKIVDGQKSLKDGTDVLSTSPALQELAEDN